LIFTILAIHGNDNTAWKKLERKSNTQNGVGNSKGKKKGRMLFAKKCSPKSQISNQKNLRIAKIASSNHTNDTARPAAWRQEAADEQEEVRKQVEAGGCRRASGGEGKQR
jgi:hypothetical protein